jgi:hypothetical protein
MATATSARGAGSFNAYDTIAASTTDSPLVAAPGGNLRVRVHAFFINHGDTTPSPVTFNSKGSGAGTAIFPVLKYPANGGTSVGDPGQGRFWFSTNPGEALTVTTGVGSNTSIGVVASVGP